MTTSTQPHGRTLLVDGVRHRDSSDAAIAALLADRGVGFLWLDLVAGDDANAGLLADVFRLHPLSVEDVSEFGQRPKVEDYDDYVYLVMFGAAGEGDADRLAEVHVLAGERYIITVHHDDCPTLGEAGNRAAVHRRSGPRGPHLLYRVLDALVDSFFPLLDEVDADIVDIEQALDDARSQATTRQRIFELRRRLVTIRRAVAPARDQMARLAAGTIEVPGMGDDAPRYFRDIEDHLIRITDTLDGYRDLLAGLTDVYLSTISNRLNAVMKQLSVVAGIFLPLSFLTGFFGQNFGWMVEHMGGPTAFWGLGIGLQVAAAVLLLAYFRRRRWL